ncbi:MAG: hypothetical protein AB7K41_00300 [Bdellovibrionales bacterium]
MPLLFFVLLAVMFFGTNAKAADFSGHAGATLTGAAASILMHESGHALAAKAVGWQIVAFKPYPTKLKIPLKEGGAKEVWAGGLVHFLPSEPAASPERRGHQAWVSAMGSVGNSLAVLALAPLLPELGGFGAMALNDAMIMSTFDWPAYALIDSLVYWKLLKGTPYNDWHQVSLNTGIATPWYFLAGMGVSFLLNQYHRYWQNEAAERGALPTEFRTNIVGAKFLF